jgi:hypothetical protein
MPRIVPSVAADTVPEYIVLIAVFAPWLIPEMSKSIFLSFRSVCTASLTESAGVPSIA